MERKNLSTMLDTPVKIFYDGNGINVTIRCELTGALLATVAIADLFDKDGNRFNDDVYE